MGETEVGPTVPERWMAVGRSHDQDARTAGRAALAQALCGGADPKLLIVYCSHRHDASTLVEEIRTGSGGVPLIGCTTSGEISNDGPSDGGVLVTAIGGSGFQIDTGFVPEMADQPRESGAELAALLRPSGPQAQAAADSGHTIMLLLTNGLNPGQQRIIHGVYGVLGPSIPLVGGAAGDSQLARESVLFCDDKVFNDAIVGAMIKSTGPLGIGVRHGWRRVGEAMLVTASTGNRIDSIDDRPALDVYLDRLNAPPECHTDQDAFAEFAISHPFGFVRRSGEAIRSSSVADFEGRAVYTIDEVPQGKLLWLMEGDASTTLSASDQACADAIAALGDEPDGTARRAQGLLVFDCLARRHLLGDGDDGIRQEAARMSRIADGVPIAGFYTYGEIARTHGVYGFHNQTLVALALG